MRRPMDWILVVLLLVALALCVAPCTDESAATRTLRGAGFTDIRLTGYQYFICDKGDRTCTGFQATGPLGERVSGAVGCGWGCGKGCTIRFDR